MNTFRRLIIHVFILTPWAASAQGVSDFYQNKSESVKKYALRAGANYSFPIVSSIPRPQLIRLGGVIPRYGFYVGGSYYKTILPDQLSLRLDATFQQKGVGSEYNGQTLLKANYYYLGVTPLIGLHLTKNLTLMAGFEANQLIRKQNTWGFGDPFEIGTTLRLNYAVGRYRAEISYFKGLTKFDQADIPVSGVGPFDFYNQNVQIGFIYTWARL